MGLSILAAIGLLVLIVWALHRNQRRVNEENVDRNLPLPPLQLSETEVTRMSELDEDLDLPQIATSHRPTPVATKTALASTLVPVDQWLARSRESLAKGEFVNALQQCHSALPQMGAFRQCCMVLRAQIRELKKKRQSYDDALEQLYRIAALADFFHGKTPNMKALPPSAIKQINFSRWEALRCPYAELGFKHLSLLTKTDAKWLVQQWGEPEEHAHMRELHLNQWKELHNSL